MREKSSRHGSIASLTTPSLIVAVGRDVPNRWMQRQLLPRQQTDDGYRYQELHAALNVLPEKERTAVLLFYLQGYAVKEIAEIMGGSIPAVKKQLERGRDKLKVTLPRAV